MYFCWFKHISPAFANIMLGVVFLMNNQRMQKFRVKYSINYPSGKKWFAEKEVYGITQLGAKDVIYWLHSNKDISIISVEPTYKYSALAVYGDNHTVGER